MARLEPQPEDMQVKNILVPTDFSACSRKALLYAGNIARRYNSKLTLLHVLPPRPPLIPELPDEDGTLRDALDQMKEFQADLLSKGMLRDIPHQLVVKRGKDWYVVSRILQEENIDLIVMGTNGKTGLKRLFLGSFAENVFRNSPCPVVTVGPHIDDEVATEYPKHILFPTDESYASKSAEPYAYQLGRTPGAELTLLGVVHGKSGVNERLKRALERLQATGLYVAWREGGTTPKVVADTGPNVKAILRVAERRLADLIVLGISESDEERLGWADAYEVVCSALCPVLTIRHTFPDPYFKRLLEMEPVQPHSRAPLTSDGQSCPSKD